MHSVCVLAGLFFDLQRKPTFEIVCVEEHSCIQFVSWQFSNVDATECAYRSTFLNDCLKLLLLLLFLVEQ